MRTRKAGNRNGPIDVAVPFLGRRNGPIDVAVPFLLMLLMRSPARNEPIDVAGAFRWMR